MTAQDLITTSIIGLEAFLSNNVEFENNDSILTFIENVRREDYKYNITDYLDRSITGDELEEYLKNHMKDPTQFRSDLIKPYISVMTPELISRIYYKNQIPELVKNSWFRDKLGILVGYEYSQNPDPEMVPYLEEFKEKMLEFTFYDKMYEDRYKRAVKDCRKSVIVIDTDLTIGSVH